MDGARGGERASGSDNMGDRCRKGQRREGKCGSAPGGWLGGPRRATTGYSRRALRLLAPSAASVGLHRVHSSGWSRV
eukprot:2105010-Pleurochrysis_carterae.AAC.2